MSETLFEEKFPIFTFQWSNQVFDPFQIKQTSLNIDRWKGNFSRLMVSQFSGFWICKSLDLIKFSTLVTKIVKTKLEKKRPGLWSPTRWSPSPRCGAEPTEASHLLESLLGHLQFGCHHQSNIHHRPNLWPKIIVSKAIVIAIILQSYLHLIVDIVESLFDVVQLFWERKEPWDKANPTPLSQSQHLFFQQKHMQAISSVSISPLLHRPFPVPITIKNCFKMITAT